MNIMIFLEQIFQENNKLQLNNLLEDKVNNLN